MKQVLLWLLAVVITVAAVLYQRMTGPTYPVKGALITQSQEFKYKLIRTHETTGGAKITLPNTGDSSFEAQLHYKRYQTKDEMTVLPFTLEDDAYKAQLPVQASAGKMEYFVTGTIDNKSFRMPVEGKDNIVLRYKDPVPNGVLIPHIFFMFFAILFGMRAAISALFDVDTMRRWTLISFIGMTVGGIILGPIVQKYAFGEYWTGFPYGGDFTDNKMLIMWLAWAIAMLIIGLKPRGNEKFNRVIVLMAAVVMTAVYLIPHSMGGSTLDYDKVDQGINPSEAIKTGAE